MEGVIHSLIIALRNSGVRISVSESLDAMHAASLTGYGNRQVLKDGLAAALAKSQAEKDLFDACFDRFFSPHHFSDPQGNELPTNALDKEEDYGPLAQMVLSGDNAGLSVAMREAAEHSDIKGIRFFTQKSLYIQKILKGMGFEGLELDIRRLAKQETTRARQEVQTLKRAKDFLFESVRDFVEKQYILFAETATEEILRRYLRDVRLTNLEARDFNRMHAIIQKMVKRLNDVHSRHRITSKRGRPDLKKTLRANLSYQGLLFDVRWKSRKKDRPDIVAICDVSRSVETVSRFMLLFLYSLNEEVAKIRSFIFCSNLVEVSHIFDECDVAEALARLKNGSGLGILLGRTDYGQALKDFTENWPDSVSRHTTVLIMGDARNNHGDPQAHLMKRIHERCKRVIWLNPEPPTFWGTGDSEMNRYLPYCYLTKECSTVRHLERVVSFLLRPGA